MLRIMLSYAPTEEKVSSSFQPLTRTTLMKQVVFEASLDDEFHRFFDSYESARSFVLMRIGWDLAEFGRARLSQYDDDPDLQVFYACVFFPGGSREYSIHPEVLR